MKTIKYLTILLIFATLVDCSEKEDADEPEVVTPQQPEVGAPVETLPKNRNYPSAFAGQTRIGGVKTTTTISTR